MWKRTVLRRGGGGPAKRQVHTDFSQVFVPNCFLFCSSISFALLSETSPNILPSNLNYIKADLQQMLNKSPIRLFVDRRVYMQTKPSKRFDKKQSMLRHCCLNKHIVHAFGCFQAPGLSREVQGTDRFWPKG